LYPLRQGLLRTITTGYPLPYSYIKTVFTRKRSGGHQAKRRKEEITNNQSPSITKWRLVCMAAAWNENVNDFQEELNIYTYNHKHHTYHMVMLLILIQAI
jgi:hypothetical protein